VSRHEITERERLKGWKRRRNHFSVDSSRAGPSFSSLKEGGIKAQHPKGCSLKREGDEVRATSRRALKKFVGEEESAKSSPPGKEISSSRAEAVSKSLRSAKGKEGE